MKRLFASTFLALSLLSGTSYAAGVCTVRLYPGVHPYLKGVETGKIVAWGNFPPMMSTNIRESTFNPRWTCGHALPPYCIIGTARCRKIGNVSNHSGYRSQSYKCACE